MMLTRKAKLHYAHEVHMTESFPVFWSFQGCKLFISHQHQLKLSSATNKRTTTKLSNQACNKLYRCMTGCRFAEFALLEQPSCESLDQEPSPGPSQVEIVVQVSLHFP